MIYSSIAASQIFFIISDNWAADVAVFYALEEDLKALRGDSSFSASTINGTKLQTFRVANHRVFATQMGVSNVETAINATNLLVRNRCDLAVSLGPTGSLDDSTKVGTIIRVQKVVGYQRGTWTRAGWELSPSASLVLPEKFLNLQLSEAIQLGDMGSGDAFVASRSARERVAKESACRFVDMNSFGLVQACEKPGVPLVIFKVVSDEAGDEAGQQFRDFVSSYDGALGRALRDAIQNLPVSVDSPAAYENIRQLLE